MLQRTIAKAIEFEGIGLHSGQTFKCRVLPARANQGIHFVRRDLPGKPSIPARFENVIQTKLATTLGVKKGGQVIAHISTVEHLMAALALLEIDNVTIEVDGAEVPILDGSSRPFIKALRAAGIEELRAAKKYIRVLKSLELRQGDKHAIISPANRLEVHGSIEWAHPAVGFQQFHFVQGATSVDSLDAARTFGFVRDVEALRAAGLALGGSFENAVVLDDAKVLNAEGLRYPDEFVRHKVLDAIGDFALAGLPIKGKMRLHRSGHDFHLVLLQALLSQPENFEIEGVESQDEIEEVLASLANTARALAQNIA